MASADKDEEEIWHEVMDDDLDGCFVSTKGRVRDEDGDIQELKPDDSNGYVQYRGHRVHRLVLSNIVGPPPGAGFTVDHRNRDRSDNRVSNLRWATLVEQAANKKQRACSSVRSTQGELVLEFNSVPAAIRYLQEENTEDKTSPHDLRRGIHAAIHFGTTFRERTWARVVKPPVGRITTVRGHRWHHVSDCGMIQRPSGQWTPGTKYEKSKYFTITMDGKLRKVHDVIAEEFCPGKTFHMNTVCHLNGIFTDNRSENLQWMTRKDKYEHEIKLGVRTPRKKPVKRRKLNPPGVPMRQICPKTGDTLCVYVDGTLAAEYVGGTKRLIENCAARVDPTCAGYKWAFACWRDVTKWE